MDGRDETLFRKVTVGFKPRTRGQRRNLLSLLAVCQEVYNGALQERRDAYKHPTQTKIKAFDQFNQLTQVRELREDLFAFGLQPLRSTIKRVDEGIRPVLRPGQGRPDQRAEGWLPEIQVQGQVRHRQLRRTYELEPAP